MEKRSVQNDGEEEFLERWRRGMYIKMEERSVYKRNDMRVQKRGGVSKKGKKRKLLVLENGEKKKV